MENNKNEALEESVCKRCEDILSEDEAYQKLNSTILELKYDFKLTLTPKQIKEYNKIEKKNMESIISAAFAIYNMGVRKKAVISESSIKGLYAVYIIDRIMEIEKDELQINNDYIKQKNIEHTLIKQIQGLLLEEHRHLVQKLRDVVEYQCAIAEYVMYERGLREGEYYGQ